MDEPTTITEFSKLPPDSPVLKDSDWYPTHILHVTDKSDTCATGVLYEVDNWGVDDPERTPIGVSEIGVVHLKWDGCAHVGLRDPELNKEWVHVCGAKHMLDTLNALLWAWTTLQRMIPKYDSNVGGELEEVV